MSIHYRIDMSGTFNNWEQFSKMPTLKGARDRVKMYKEYDKGNLPNGSFKYRIVRVSYSEQKMALR